MVAAFFIGLSCSSGTHPTVAGNPQHHVRNVGVIQNQDIAEASGMAYSQMNRDLLWIVNDSGDEPVIYAVGTDGADRGRVRLLEAENRDWEDLASFRFKNEAYLLVADVGDNKAARPYVFLYILKEPSIVGGQMIPASNVNWIQKIQFTFEDGSRDCEAVAADITEQKILLLTKRDRPPVLYELPLELGIRTQTAIAKRLKTVDTIPLPTAADFSEDPLFGRFRSQPTAMDISRDGMLAVVQTYKYAYLFSKSESDSWATVFSVRPKTVVVPKLKQTEAVCFGSDGSHLYLTSEQRPAPIYRINIQKGDSL